MKEFWFVEREQINTTYANSWYPLGPNKGYFFGEKEDVIELIELLYDDDFKYHLIKGQARLTKIKEIKPLEVDLTIIKKCQKVKAIKKGEEKKEKAKKNGVSKYFNY